MLQAPIRVLLVDDSPVALAVVKRMLATSPQIEVVGTATNGRDALEMIPRLEPAVICTDYHMPVMNGLEFVTQVMARFPRPILVISTAVAAADMDRVFSLLQAGAVDVYSKPRGLSESDVLAAEYLIKKVKIVAGVWVRGWTPKATAAPAAPPITSLTTKLARPLRPPQIIAIGASTGGPQALQTILSQLPADFPLPILCVQHISNGFLPGLVSWLGKYFKGKVQIASNGEIPRPGCVYFPPENTHLVVDRSGRMQASEAPALGGHRPSVTVTFRSMAEHYRDASVGVLLTGMGRDGGEGMQAMAEVGAQTIAQNEASCIVYGMPKDAVERGAARLILPLYDIADAVIKAADASSYVGGEKM
jgi:two-component system chemotaxis response regulator CheB